MKSFFLFLAVVIGMLGTATAQSERQTTLFTDGWKFYKGDVSGGEKELVNDASWRTVDLPHDWSIEGPFSQEWASGTGFLPAGIGWYRKIFNSDAATAGKRVFIYFDGVYKNSEVWLNGHSLGKRPNGFLPFQYELTPHLKKGANTIAVRVDHTHFADARFYTGSGIYRNVYLITKNPVHIALWGTQFTTPFITSERATADVTVSVANTLATTANVRVEAHLRSGTSTVATAKQNLPVASRSTKDAKLQFSVPQPKLWSVGNPNLYTLAVTVYRDGKKVDEYSEKVGFRTIRFDANKGFFLNGQNMKMKGICIHHDAGALGAAVPREVWQRRLVRLKELGCNAIRMSHYPHQDYLYDLCDEMGFLVQDEAFDEWEVSKNKWVEGWNVGKPGREGNHESFQQWAEQDVEDMIRRNKNHPSIIMWSIGNEIDYPNDPYSHEVLSTGRNPQIYGRGYQPGNPPVSRLGELSKMLVTAAKSVDTTRPITAALAGVVMSNQTTYPENLDIVGYNYQEYRYADDHKAYPNRIIYGSENGKSNEAWIAVDTSKNIFAQFLWTGYDFMGEAGRWPARSSGAGLIDLAGFPKPEFYARQALWVKEPVLYLVASKPTTGQPERGRRLAKPSWNWTAGDTVRVACFTNADEVELFLNGKSLGRKSKGDMAARGLFWTVNYEPGELLVKGFTGGKEVSTHQLTTAGEPATIVAVADKNAFAVDGRGVAHVELGLHDKNGVLVYDAVNELTIDIEGPATLLGLESGDLASHEDYKSNKRKVYNGRLLAYIKSTGKPGEVRITVSSPRLKSASVSIPSSNLSASQQNK